MSEAAQLAYVEITVALAAIHARFLSELPTVIVPGAKVDPQNKNAVARLSYLDNRKRTVDRLTLKSTELTACDEPQSVIHAITNYEGWLSELIEKELDGDMGFEAGHSVIKPLRELRSIYRVARPYPENAAKRAKSIAARVSDR